MTKDNPPKLEAATRITIAALESGIIKWDHGINRHENTTKLVELFKSVSQAVGYTPGESSHPSL